MRIIDNKKDYYDYLSGVYGIDNLIVYDRRGIMKYDGKIPKAELRIQSLPTPSFPN